MKSTHILVLAFAVALYCTPAIAQHGHPGGMGGGTGGGMGGGMGSGAAGSMGHGATGHNANASNSPGTAQGKTMDQLLSQNTVLAGKIQTLTGMNAQQSCSGFKNLGQCVAAAHVSKNLGISFTCLQSDMTGTAPAQGTSCPAGTGTKTMSLGKSIQTLSPTVNSKSEAKKAAKQAQQDLNQSNS